MNEAIAFVNGLAIGGGVTAWALLVAAHSRLQRREEESRRR